MDNNMKLRNLIKEAEDQWTGKDLIDTAQALVLAKKSLIGAIRNLEKLENIMSKSKNKPQGDVLYRMLPVMKLSGQLAKLDKLDKGMGHMFSKEWAALKKKGK
jgi:hypothetical protein